MTESGVGGSARQAEEERSEVRAKKSDQLVKHV
jgi:hypothetical protein